MFVYLLLAAFSAPPPIIEDAPRRRSDIIVHVELQREDGPMCVEPEMSPDFLGSILFDEPSVAERILIERQLTLCKRDVWRTADPWLALALLRYEETLGVPAGARGILGAVWCWEGAMYSDPERLRGDWRNGSPTSFGPFQMQTWMFERCRMPLSAADDLFSAASCYWRRVAELEADGKCPGNWARAEAMTANGRKYQSQGCRARSLHWKELERWKAVAD